jgi:hypothetical protein
MKCRMVQENVCKKPSRPIWRYHLHICLEGLRKITKSLSHDSRSVDQESNQQHLKYEAAVVYEPHDSNVLFNSRNTSRPLRRYKSENCRSWLHFTLNCLCFSFAYSTGPWKATHYSIFSHCLRNFRWWQYLSDIRFCKTLYNVEKPFWKLNSPRYMRKHTAPITAKFWCFLRLPVSVGLVCILISVLFLMLSHKLLKPETSFWIFL